MLRETFTHNMTGSLQNLSGEYPSRYGLIHYETCAFIPNPLDEKYPDLSQKAVGAIARASMALARLSELGDGIPNPDLLRRPTMRREAQSTSALEGTFERLETVLAQDYEPGEDKTGWSESLIEVFNYIDAADHGVRSIHEGRPIGLPLVRDLQRTLVSNTKSDNPQSGEIRNSQVFIGSPTRRIEDARFVPMPPGQGLEVAVRSLMDWWNTRNEPGLAVLDMAMFHYQFETLHPFTDGNGRIGRLLILLQMMSRGLLSQPLLSVSPWFEQRRSEYQDRLLEVSTRGDWEDWVLFFCQGIEESCEDALLRVKRLNRIRDRYRELIGAHRYSGSTMEIAMLLIGQPYVFIPDLKRRLGKSDSAIRNALGKLESLGIVSVRRIANIVEYVADDVLLAIRAPQGSPINPDAPLVRETGEDPHGAELQA